MNLKQLRNLSEAEAPPVLPKYHNYDGWLAPLPINIPGLDSEFYHPDGSGGDWIDDWYWDGPDRPSLLQDIFDTDPGHDPTPYGVEQPPNPEDWISPIPGYW